MHALQDRGTDVIFPVHQSFGLLDYPCGIARRYRDDPIVIGDKVVA
jgi:hypothetical protein